VGDLQVKDWIELVGDIYIMIYAYVYVCIYIYIYIYICKNIYIYTYLYVFIYVYDFVNARVAGCNVEHRLFEFNHTKSAAGNKEDANCFIYFFALDSYMTWHG